MSHFTVLVIGPNPEKQLAPFQENNMGDCPKEFLEFEDYEDEWRKQYETEGTEQVILVDGSYLYPWDSQFVVKPRESGPQSFLAEKKYEYPERSIKKEVPFNVIYATFEEFVKEYHSKDERDPETGRYGYWSNPNSKWDWYELGGRWTGFFKMKPGIKGTAGRPGLMTSPAKDGYADRALKKDIDFEAMRNEEGESAAKRWEDIHSHIDGKSWKTWAEVKSEHGNVEVAREVYWKQEAVKAAKQSKYCGWSGCDEYRCTKEEYVQKARGAALQTFAVLKDGQWYEKGTMGWWGTVSGEKNPEEWSKQFQQLLDELPDDTLLSVYDCHV